ncbi:hypothetical protein Agub_g1289, partial [Astrephomene gubernaculifera]
LPYMQQQQEQQEPEHEAAGAASSPSSCQLLYVYSGAPDNPAAGVSLRAIDPDRFVVWDEAAGRALEEIEADKVFYQVYDGAVYLFQGRSYLCSALRLGERLALVRPADVKYFTRLRDCTEVHVTGGRVAYPGCPAAARSP